MNDALKVVLLKMAQKKVVNYKLAEQLGLENTAFHRLYGDEPQKAFNKLNPPRRGRI